MSPRSKAKAQPRPRSVETSRGPASASERSRGGPKPKPVLKTCEVILNYDCNAKCLFCYHPGQLRGRDLPLKDAARALLAGRKKGCWIAYFIGGEITLRPDLDRIVGLAKSLGYPCIQIMSNGLALADKAYAGKLVDAGANMFRLSIHGHDRALHDRLTQVPGAHDKVLRAIENILELGGDVSVNQTINALNYRTLPRFVEGLLDRFPLKDINIIYTHYRGEMSVNLDLLKVPISKVLPYVREGMRIFLDRGVEIEAPMLVNFTPCLLPGMEHLMSEWERLADSGDDDLLVHPEGHTSWVYDMKERERVMPRSCRRCVYVSRCIGFEKEYAALYGTKEYQPLLKVPKPFPLYPTYARMDRLGVACG